ncbi:hypothetical protein BJ165DRAFT_1528663 [Panaeolus papilionaceus]|nr:hypothetical protein BJ165DRAFT_1528663 [Panaeolus papilionaceus]
MASSWLQSPTFPLEIFHLIVKNLAYSEPNDDDIVLNIKVLRRCSLVCRAWVPICQAYLFKSGKVDLERISDSGPEKGIIRAITANPHIASYVQKIRYTATLGAEVGHILDQNILTLLTLPNLHSIHVLARGSQFNQLCTGDLVFSRLWVDCISSKLASLTDLTIHWVKNVPLVSLLSCPNLKSLSLSACICADWETQPASTMVASTSKIECLKLTDTTNVPYAFIGLIPRLKQLSVYETQWRIQPQFKDQFILTLRGLEKLTVDYRWVENPQSWVYLPLSMASGMGVKLFEHLQDLTVMPDSEQEVAEIYQALRHAPSIRYLDVSYLSKITGNGKASTPSKPYPILSFVQSPASLEELVMTLKIDVSQLLTLFVLIRRLKTLDTALFRVVESSMFPLLRWITFHIYVQYADTSAYPPKIDNKVQADLYHYIESSFPAFRRSSTSRINLKLWAEKDKADD